MTTHISSSHTATPLVPQSELLQQLQLALGTAARALDAAAALLPKLQQADGNGSTPVLAPYAPGGAMRFPLSELELLHGELDTLVTDGTPISLFGGLVTELGRRACIVQRLHPVARPKTRRFIRRLTAAAARKGLHLRGLRRRDMIGGNVVSEPARCRERPWVGAQAPDTQPEPPPLPLRMSVDTTDAYAPQSYAMPLDIPHVRALAHGLAVVVVGGQVKKETLRRLVAEAEIDIEWVGTSKNSPRPIDALAKRIRAGHVAALVLTEAFISHKHTVPLTATARMNGVPIAYSGRGGLAKLRQGLVLIERQFTAEHVARPAA